MKALKLIVFGIVLFLAGTTKGQVSVSVNIGSPPMWGPVGYSDVRYYYLPDVEAYYDIHTSMFIYYNRGAWVHRNYLPRRYRNYDLYNGYKVVMTDYRGDAPYSNYKEYRIKYARGYHGSHQNTIGERHDNRHQGRHDNGKYDKRENHDNDKNVHQNNDKGNSHNNDRNMKGNHDKGGGKGKRK